MQLVRESILGKLPLEEERKLVAEIYEDLGEAYTRTWLPLIVFDKDIVKQRILNAKEKLERLVG